MAHFPTMPTTNSRIHDLLASTGLFDAEQLSTILTDTRENGVPIREAALTVGKVKEEAFLAKLAEAMGLPFRRLKDVEIEPDILEKIPTKAIFQ